MNHTFTILEEHCDLTDELPTELDIANMKPDVGRTERLRTYARMRQIQLDPDLVEFFKTSEAINEALRRVMREMQSN
jgi:uncharacterized protein (DUF4415 family)